jgi:hypothetical protein
MGEHNYNDQAYDDAREMLSHFVDEIASQAQDGDVSDDLLNDYSCGDSYHHENHVDKDYRLQEAAALLDELSADEETDEGLWQGMEPRRAVAAQAAYTYGNAVMRRWRDFVTSLNDTILNNDDNFLGTEGSEDNREGFARLYCILVGDFKADSWDNDLQTTMARAARAALQKGDTAESRILADWLEEKGDGWSMNRATDIRAAADLADKEEDNEEDRCD